MTKSVVYPPGWYLQGSISVLFITSHQVFIDPQDPVQCERRVKEKNNKLFQISFDDQWEPRATGRGTTGLNVFHKLPLCYRWGFGPMQLGPLTRNKNRTFLLFFLPCWLPVLLLLILYEKKRRANHLKRFILLGLLLKKPIFGSATLLCPLRVLRANGSN